MTEGLVEVRVRTAGGEARTLTYWPLTTLNTLVDIISKTGVYDLYTSEGTNYQISTQFVVDSLVTYFEIIAE